MPFHSQVSPRPCPRPSLPPNSTETARCASNAIADCPRTGGSVAGDACVQLVPFHSHVSLPLPYTPLNNTVRARALSNVIAAWTRAVGEAAGERRDQFVPSHSQVSLNRLKPDRPPNS